MSRKKRKARAYKQKEKFLKRSGRTNRHHIKAKSKGGGITGNIIRMDVVRHRAFHLLFGNMTFSEAARLLLRAEAIIRRKP